MRRSYCILTLCLALLLSSAELFSQAGSATLNGRVTDPQGLPVVGARVEALNVNTNVSYPSLTNDTGFYSVPSIPPGSYRILVNKEGFEETIKPDVIVHVADNLAANLTLQIGSVQQSVIVEGGAPLVNTTTSSLGGLVSDTKIENMPLNGRNYIDLQLMQPGVQPSPNLSRSGSFVGTWFTSNGAPMRSNNFTIDGAIRQNLNNGTTATQSGTTLGLDGVQEYRMLSNAYSAEYGLTMGSQTIMVSKSGTNKFHGSAFEYLRNSAMDAANYFDHPVAANNFARLPPFKRNNFGAAFGGPIKKDKTFFFLVYEGLRERLGVTENTLVFGAGCHGPAGAQVWNGVGVQPAGSIGPCPEIGGTTSSMVTIAPVMAPLLALYPLPNLPGDRVTFPANQPTREDFGQARVDHVLSSKDSVFVRYTIDDVVLIAPLIYPGWEDPKISRNQFLTLSETHIVSPSLLNTFRTSFSRTTGDWLTTDLTGPQYSFVPGRPLGQINVGGIGSPYGPLSFAPDVQHQNIFTFSDDVVYSKGAHSFKFGTLINRYQQNGFNSSNLRGTINFAGTASFLQGLSNRSLAIVPGAIVGRNFRFSTIGFYAQDEWHLRARLVVTLGLRYEPMTEITETHGLSSALVNVQTDANYTVGRYFKNPSRRNWSPRIGFAWDVFGDGKTAVRGGAALLYDIANYGNALYNFPGAQPPFSATSTVPTTVLITVPLTFPANSVGRSGNSTFQYNLQQPRMFTENLTIERQLPFLMALSASYAGSRGIHLITFAEGNPKVPAGFANGVPVWDANLTDTLPNVNPNWGNMNLYSSSSDSIYHSLQVSLIKRTNNGLEFQSSYTWSKLIDNTEGMSPADATATSVYRINPFDMRFDRGLSSLNVPHNWVVNGTYNLPSPKTEQPVVRSLTSGWAISGIFKVRNGFPFSPVIQTQRSRSGVGGGGSNFGGIDRPDWNPAFSGPVILGGPDQYFNPNAFSLPSVGHLGNVGRDTLQGPGFINLDFSVRKSTALGFIGEGGHLDFRVDAFNLLNHPNFDMPNNSVFAGLLTNTMETPLTTAGRITQTLTSSRQLQISLRVGW